MEHELKQLDDKRVEAMLQGDAETLARICDDDLIYLHTGGRVETKALWIESIRTGSHPYKQFDREDVQARVYGDTGVVTGLSNVIVHSRGEDRSFKIRFLAVYARRHDRWQFVAWQSNRISP